MTQNLGYDALDRLVTASGFWGGTGTAGYTYDSRGNRTSSTVPGSVAYAYSGERIASFAYDGNGNATSDGIGSYTYASTNLVRTATVASVVSTYSYDADDLRKVKEVAGISTWYVHGSGGMVLSEFETNCAGTPSPTKDYIYAGSRALAAVRIPGETVVTIEPGSMSTAEGSGAVTMTIRLATTRPGGTPCVATVPYSTSEGTATAGGDFTAASGVVSFPVGTTTATRTVQLSILQDGVDEPAESFSLTLGAPTGASLGIPSSASITIADDDPAEIAVADAFGYELDGGGTVAFTVTLTSAAPTAVSVAYATAPGSATSGGDYAPVSGTITIPAGSLTAAVPVTILQDGAAGEAAESFTLSLTNPSGAAIRDGSGSGTIHEPARIKTPNPGSMVSGGSATFEWWPASWPIPEGWVYYLFVGTGTQGAERRNLYDGPSYGATSITVSNLPTDGSAIYTQVFSWSVDGATGWVESTKAQFTTGNMAVSVSDASALEAEPLSFVVSLTQAASDVVTVAYATSGGTATAGTDFTQTSGTLTFTAGQTSKTITVPVADDISDEANETVNLVLSNPVGVAISDGSAVGTITDNDGAAGLSIADMSVSEGSATATFTITVAPASGQSVTAGWATGSAGTATAGSDYTAATGTVSFAAGESSRTVSVTLTGDSMDETDETFYVDLTNPTNATITDGQARATILDDDAPAAITVADGSVTEGDSGTANLTFAVSLSAPNGVQTTVAYATGATPGGTAGSAAAGVDYVASNGTLTFAAGETAKTITIVVNGDTVDESEEDMYLNLSAPTNATVADGTARGVIADNDAEPAFSIGDATRLEGDSGTASLAFAVTLSAGSERNPSVSWATGAAGTASAAVDYVAGAGAVSFAPGQTMQVVNVTVNADVLDEADETFYVNLSAPGYATIADSQAKGTITDDDALPGVRIADKIATETNGTVNAQFIVTLTAASGRGVTTTYQTGTSGTAMSGTDYTGVNGTLTIVAGQTTGTIVVPVLGDTDDEPTETYFVNLLQVTNGSVLDDQGAGTIIDDDAAPAGAPTVSVSDATVTEVDGASAYAKFTVSLSASSTLAAQVNFATGTSGTATLGTDYVAKTGTLKFAAGETSKTFTVEVSPDTADEPAETFFVNLSLPVNVTVVDGQGQGTINDDDPAPAGSPSVSISDSSITEADTASVFSRFTVTLASASTLTVQVDFSTGAAGTATSGTDYLAKTGTISFAPGETSKTFTVEVLGDVADEPAETFFANITAVNATIGDGQGQATINDNDAAPAGSPTLSVSDTTITEGTAGSVYATFVVTLSAATSGAVEVWVDFSTGAAGSATQGADYLAKAGTIKFLPGETSKTFTIEVLPDSATESSETFYVNLGTPVNATISDSQGQGTIVDND